MSQDKQTPQSPPKPQLPVGREVRRWRHARELTLAELSDRSGLNVGYLSQIENDKAAPSLEALAGIANALDVPPAWLLIDSSAPPMVVRAGDRPTTDGPGGACLMEVDGGTARELCIIEAVVPAGQSTGEHAHSGDEHHVILDGRWRMTQGDNVFELGPGDYLAWDPSVPHDVEVIGDEPGRMLVIYPRRARRPAAESPDG